MKKSMWSPVWIWESEIPSNICDQIIDCSNKIEYEKGLTQYSDDGRKVDIKFLYEEFNWINALIYGYGLFANCKNFKYELSKCDIEGVQLSRYRVGQFYNKHMDFNGDQATKSHTRKLSMSVQLSDENTYDGGDLVIHFGGKYFTSPRVKGSVIVFDSRLTHEVTPITRGERYSLVKWFHGDEPLR
tara:strand:+ start:55 stop:612 length:558 start_codon:yes stop_codon:yes gene_type:complete